MDTQDYIILGTTGPDKELTFDEFRSRVIKSLLDTLDGCSDESDVLNLIGDLADGIRDCYDDGDSVEIAADYIMDGLSGC